MGHKVKDQMQRKFVFMKKWGVNKTLDVLVKSLFL